MAFGDGDLGVFFADMGVEVAFGSQLTRGNLDEVGTAGPFEGLLVEGQTHTLEIPAAAFSPALKAGSRITADGRQFTVRQTNTVDDGSILRVALKKGWKQ